MLKSEADLQPFIDQETAKRAEDSNYEWVIKENRLQFIPKVIEKNTIPSQEMMLQSLDYAMELERIPHII